MSYVELEERPVKKRRFFVDEPEDTPIQDATVNPEPSLPGEINALPDHSSPGFNAEVFNSVVGETLPDSDIQRLRELSDNNLERGKKMGLQLELDIPLIFHSHKSVLR